MKRTIATLISWIFFLQILSPVAYSASLNLQSQDIEAPVIKFTIGETEISDGIKKFVVKVTDNKGVANVTLHYKSANGIAFISKAMKKSGPETYSTEVEVDSIISKKLEFYISAEDVSGNRVFEGQKFSPFAYTVVQKSAPPEPVDEGMSTMTLVLIGLGVLALVGGGGGSSGTSPSQTGTITINTSIPE